MNILVISYGVREPGACLVKEGGVAGIRFESEYYRDEQWTRVFPENAIADLLRDQDLEIRDIDQIAFLGKPFSCFEKLVNGHIFFFPRYFLGFLSDFRDFFTEKFRIKAIVKKRLGFEKEICYPGTMDAVAFEMGRELIPGGGTVIVSLSDTLEQRTLGCYAKKDDTMVLVKELVYPSCLSVLHRLGEPAESDCAKMMRVRDLVRGYEDGSFTLNAGSFQYDHGDIILRKGYGVADSENACILFEDILGRIIRSTVPSPDDRVIFITDHPVNRDSREKLETFFKKFSFYFLDKADKMECAAEYTVRMLRAANERASQIKKD